MELSTVPVPGMMEKGMTHWEWMRRGQALPPRSALDPADIPRLLAFSCLIEVLPGGLDFRYLIIGSAIQYASAPGQTGMKVSEMPSQRAPSIVFDLFSRVVASGQPRFARLDYIGQDARIRDVDVGAFPLAGEETPRDPGYIWSLVQLNAKS